ncbi:MAG: T9SS type A sorting domain-containing protein, partial [Crocinitomicaceae bacterium]|nr:T9SS type A sorting domain-containing protein [Crocinitomicaceae bacterium]
LLKYVITSVNGEIVMSGDLLNAHSVIDLEGLSNGTYVIKIYSTSASTEFKFVKTK